MKFCIFGIHRWLYQQGNSELHDPKAIRRWCPRCNAAQKYIGAAKWETERFVSFITSTA